MLATLLPHVEPAGGAPTEDLIGASVAGAVLVAVLGAVGWAHRTGRTTLLGRFADACTRIPHVSQGLPRWAALPIGVATGSLLLAVFGFYWDVSTHIDNGRDAGPFANPAHWFILLGLLGIALAGYLSLLLGADDDHPQAITIRPGWRVPVGGVLLFACGVIALTGFPLDDMWHRIFGQDVTLWGPTHIQMVAGASLATLAIWVLIAEARRVRQAVRVRRGTEILLGGAFLVGLCTLQAEFDFGVPQFRQLYQPVLIAIAAGIGLVTARLVIGRGGALGAVFAFAVLRGALTLLVGPVLGRTMPHFPLFVVEALVVEAVALAMPRSRPTRVGAVAGLGVGTIGLAAGWAWSHAWMPTAWASDTLPEALVWVPVAAVAAGVAGGLVARALAPEGALPEEGTGRPLRTAGALAGVALVAALAWPLPTNDGGGVRATLTLGELTPTPQRTVAVTVRTDPADAADGAAFFTLVAWQGREWTDGGAVIDHLDEVSPGVWRTSDPIPVDGDWKAILRLHEGRTLAALPVFLPHDEAIGADDVPAEPSFTRRFVADKSILQREFTGGPGWLEALAYAALAAIAAGWITLNVWGLARLLRLRPPATAVAAPAAVTVAPAAARV